MNREKKVTKIEVAYIPNFKHLWNYWFKKKALPLIRFEIVNNGKEYNNGKDQVFINFDQGGKPKYFEAKIAK